MTSFVAQLLTFSIDFMSNRYIEIVLGNGVQKNLWLSRHSAITAAVYLLTSAFSPIGEGRIQVSIILLFAFPEIH
jgi:hypothetical protein